MTGRARLNHLLAEQHKLTADQSAEARERYVAVTLEILDIARAGADLRRDWRPPVPVRERERIEATAAGVEKARAKLAELKRERNRLEALRGDPTVYAGD